VLLLIVCIASFLLRLIGGAARQRYLERQYQSNTRTTRAVLPAITLAGQLMRKWTETFTAAALNRLYNIFNNAALSLDFGGRPQTLGKITLDGSAASHWAVRELQESGHFDLLR
jgi:hypothetical protein